MSKEYEFAAKKMKKQRPETDWEIMQADSDIVEPKRNYVTSSTHPAVELKRKEKQNAKRKRPEKQ